MSVSEIDFDGLLDWSFPVARKAVPAWMKEIPKCISSMRECSFRKKARKICASSKIFRTEGAQIPNGRIGGINGINTAMKDAAHYAGYFSKIAKNYCIEWVYNASHSLIVDAVETVFLNYRSLSSPASLLKSLWKRFHKEHKQNPKAKYLQLCHSQGAAHVKNALITLPEEVRKRIIVVAIAPAAIVPNGLCFESYNYASRRDLIHYGEILADLVLAPQKIKADFEAYKELILLDPPPEADLFDHAFLSPTFEVVIARHIDNYLKANIINDLESQINQ